MSSQLKRTDTQSQPGCNVNSKLNFTVGGVATAVALVLGYLAYVFWWK